MNTCHAIDAEFPSPSIEKSLGKDRKLQLSSRVLSNVYARSSIETPFLLLRLSWIVPIALFLNIW